MGHTPFTLPVCALQPAMLLQNERVGESMTPPLSRSSWTVQPRTFVHIFLHLLPALFVLVNCYRIPSRLLTAYVYSSSYHPCVIPQTLPPYVHLLPLGRSPVVRARIPYVRNVCNIQYTSTNLICWNIHLYPVEVRFARALGG